MTDFIPLASQTDEELLRTVYFRKNVDPITLELATRLQHTLDELRKPPRNPYDFGPKDGTDPGG